MSNNANPRKINVILYMATSVNGYIATADEQTPWSEEVWASYHKIVACYKNMIVGRRTYEIMKEVNEFATLNNPLTIVVTSDKSLSAYDNIVFVKTPAQALQTLVDKHFDSALITGGSKLNQAFLEEGLVNEIYLDIEPFIFGSGLPLFAPTITNITLSLQNVSRIGKDSIQLHYHCLNK